MKINQAIKALWAQGYFKEARTTGAVAKELLDKFGITCSNLTMQLKSCKKFIRKTGSKWMQKMNSQERGMIMASNPFDELKICREIREVSEPLFQDGHYAQSVFEAYKKLTNLVKDKVTISDDGKNLMLKAFSETTPLIKINKLSNRTERNEQEGFKFMMAGAVLFIRNPKAHENIKLDKTKAIIYLGLANIFAEKIKNAE